MDSSKKEKRAGDRILGNRQGGTIVPGTPRSDSCGSESNDGHGEEAADSRLVASRDTRNVKKQGVVKPSGGAAGRMADETTEKDENGAQNAAKKEAAERRERAEKELAELAKKGESPFQRSEKAMQRSPVEVTKPTIQNLTEITCTPVCRTRKEVGSAPEYSQEYEVGVRKNTEDRERRSSIAGIVRALMTTENKGLIREEPRVLFPIEPPDLEKRRESSVPPGTDRIKMTNQLEASVGDEWEDCRSEITHVEITRGDGIITGSDGDSPNKEELRRTGMASSPAVGKIAQKNGERYNSTPSLSRAKNTYDKDWSNDDETASLDEGKLSATKTRTEHDHIGRTNVNTKRKRIISPRKITATTESTEQASRKRIATGLNEVAAPGKEKTGISLGEEDLTLLHRIGETADQIEELRQKCVKGLRGDIKGQMGNYIRRIRFGVDMLVARHGSGPNRKQAEERIMVATNRKVAALDLENAKLKTQVENLKRELEANRIKRDGVFTKKDNANGNEKDDTYAGVAGRKEMGKIKQGPKVVSVETLKGNVRICEAERKEDKTKLGITEEQLQKIVCAVAGTLGLELRHTMREGSEETNVDTGREIATTIVAKRTRKEEPLIRGMMRRKLGTMDEKNRDVSTSTANDRERQTTDSAEEESEGPWWTQRGKRKKKRAKKVVEPISKAEERTDGDRRYPKHLKLPRTAAVVMRRSREGGSYAEVMQNLEKVDLKALGIPSVQLRNGKDGEVIMQIPRANGGMAKAESLMKEIQKIAPEDLRVSCPNKKVGLRLTGFYETTTPSDVASKIGQLTGLEKGKIAVGRIATSRGVGRVIVHVPIEEATLLSEMGSIMIGWTKVGVTLMEPRKVQCYRCLEFGHARARCDSRIDRSKMCYNCGEEGHRAAECTGETRCPICGPGKEKHRLGSRLCSKVEDRKGTAGGQPDNQEKV